MKVTIYGIDVCMEPCYKRNGSSVHVEFAQSDIVHRVVFHDKWDNIHLRFFVPSEI